jgi:alpha-galactosidase
VRSGLLLSAAVALWLLSPPHAGAVPPTPVEMAEARQWAAAKFVDAGKTGSAETFFSFTYDGKPSAGFLGMWDLKRTVRPLDAQRTEHTLTYFDSKSGLLIRCVGVENHAFPTVEWTLYFKNTGGKDTPILSDIQALDAIIGPRSPGNVLLHHFKGDRCTRDSFEPLSTTLTPGIDRRFAPVGGRPSNGE